MYDQAPFLPQHGGDKLAMAAFCGTKVQDICDFSVNVRPDGPPDYIRLSLVQTLCAADTYPSPCAEEARAACARRYGLPENCLVFGNGTSELFVALARALKESGCPVAAIAEPAFGDYAAACHKAGLATVHPACVLKDSKRRYAPSGRRTLLDWELPVDALMALPGGAAVFLANPGNPAGTFLAPGQLVALMNKRLDIVWILDEAFLLYVARDNLVSFLPQLGAHLRTPAHSPLPTGLRCVVVRSLTKFHALAGVRAGFMAATPDLAGKVQQEVPLWNVNCFAIAASCAVLTPSRAKTADERATRASNRKNRRELLEMLAYLALTPCRSCANYLLLRLDTPMPDLARMLLKKYGIAIRDCATYPTLQDGTWFRVAVRTREDNVRLARALQETVGLARDVPKSAPAFLQEKPVPALMLQGTSSGAGKTLMAAAFCRIFRQDGYNVAPFKAQNMSLNSGVTWDEMEMSRAQILQARAAGIAPDVRMNPVLLKPLSDRGSQVILMGKPHAVLDARAFLEARTHLREPICEAYHSLAREHDIMVLEGAGSPGEVNLKTSDLVNMNMAMEAKARVLLVGDIDRGGVYASFLGTWLTFTARERSLLSGFLVNRFRGDASLLQPAHEYVEQATGVPVLGVVPFVPHLDLPEEDSLSLSTSMVHAATMPDSLDVALIVLGRTSNFTDMAPLALEPDVTLRPVHSVEEWGNPDIIILPGSRSVALDARKLDEKGLTEKILEHAHKGGWIVGICGGMQMLGEEVCDPLHMESEFDTMPGLGLLPLRTTLEPGKALHYREHVLTPLGVPCQGYEIHHGQTTLLSSEPALFRLAEEEGSTGFLGVLHEHVLGTYLHGLFDNDAFRRRFLDLVRTSLGKKPQGRILATWDIDTSLDKLAATVREHVDMNTIYHLLGIK